MKTKEKKLAITFTKKIFCEDDKLNFDKEFIVRKTKDQYAMVISNNIRYVMFFDDGHYNIVGRLMGGNKYKNYTLSEFTLEKIKKEMNFDKKTEQLSSEQMARTLNFLISGEVDTEKKFKKYIEKHFGTKL